MGAEDVGRELGVQPAWGEGADDGGDCGVVKEDGEF